MAVTVPTPRQTALLPTYVCLCHLGRTMTNAPPLICWRGLWVQIAATLLAGCSWWPAGCAHTLPNVNVLGPPLYSNESSKATDLISPLCTPSPSLSRGHREFLPSCHHLFIFQIINRGPPLGRRPVFRLRCRTLLHKVHCHLVPTHRQTASASQLTSTYAYW